MAVDLSGVWNPLSPKTGWVSTVEEVDHVLCYFSRSSDISFVSGKKYAEYGKNLIPAKTSRIFYTDKNDVIPFDGVPFVFVSCATKECLFRRDKHHLAKTAQKEKRNEDLMSDHPKPTKTRILFQPSRKKGCSATITIKEVIRYTDFKVDRNTPKMRKTMSRKIKDAENVNVERRFYISIPGPEDHTNHPVSQITGLFNPVDKQIREKIFELVSSGVTTVSECKRHLRVFVENEYTDRLPSKTNLGYFPLDQTIRKHMYLSQQKLKYSQLDQENMLHLVTKWSQENPGDRYLCIPSKMTTNEHLKEDVQHNDVTVTKESFFFCHQSKFQRHLLQRYGNEICLLDATYRTTKYALPLFFLAVPTNMGYSVVGEFVVEQETTDAIKQGLATIKEWMTVSDWEWKPRHFMTDFCEAEINAIEDIFPDTVVYLCDFHREQSWTRWLSKKDNGMNHSKDKVLGMLRKCASSSSEQDFWNALEELQNSAEWHSSTKLQNWISKKWLPEKKRWVCAYRCDGHIIVNTNNGIERQNKAFKYTYLEQRKTSTLSKMITTLIDEYLPAMMLKYVKSNVTFSESMGNKYEEYIPPYLKDRPPFFLKHCMKKIELADLILYDEIQCLDSGYLVQSQTDGGKKYLVSLAGFSDTCMPSCDCFSFKTSHLPCKHMFAVIRHCDTATFNDFPASYRNSPFFTLDHNVPQLIGPTTEITTEVNNTKERVPKASESEQICTSFHRPEKIPKRISLLCRERLSLIHSKTYICTNVDVLNEVNERLLLIDQLLEGSLQTDLLSGFSTEKNGEDKPGKKSTSIRKRKNLNRTNNEKKAHFILERVKEWRNTLTDEKWNALSTLAENSKSVDFDCVVETAHSATKCFTDDQTCQLYMELRDITPPTISEAGRHRLCQIALNELVQLGIIQQAYDVEKRREKEALVMENLVNCVAEMEGERQLDNNDSQIQNDADKNSQDDEISDAVSEPPRKRKKVSFGRTKSKQDKRVTTDKLCFVCHLKDFFENVPVTSEKLCREIQDIWPQYTYGQQQDAAEFAAQVLQQLEEKCLINDGSATSEKLNKMFFGRMESSVKCTDCGFTSTTTENFNHLILSMKTAKDLQGAIDNFFRPEEIEDVVCRRCNKRVSGIKEQSLAVIPNYLIVHLKRFRCNGTKEGRDLAVPSVIRLRKYVSGNREEEDKLRLTSFVKHEGTHVQGHYVAFVEYCMKWFEIDDMKIRGVSAEKLKGSLNSSYILFF